MIKLNTYMYEITDIVVSLFTLLRYCDVTFMLLFHKTIRHKYDGIKSSHEAWMDPDKRNMTCWILPAAVAGRVAGSSMHGPPGRTSSSRNNNCWHLSFVYFLIEPWIRSICFWCLRVVLFTLSVGAMLFSRSFVHNISRYLFVTFRFIYLFIFRIKLMKKSFCLIKK